MRSIPILSPEHRYIELFLNSEPSSRVSPGVGGGYGSGLVDDYDGMGGGSAYDHDLGGSGYGGGSGFSGGYNSRQGQGFGGSQGGYGQGGFGNQGSCMYFTKQQF